MATRSEIVKKIKNKFDITPEEARVVVDTITEEITDTLAKGGRVELRGFGSFSVRERKSIIARNPKTGEKLQLPARKVVYFRQGNILKKSLNKTRK